MQVHASYEEAIARRFPEQVAIAIVKDAQGKYNPITLGWTMLASHLPPMMVIAIGKQRYSLAAFRSARQFVISFPSSKMTEDAVFHGTKTGREMDKLTAARTKTLPASAIDCVILADAVANFECVLESELEAGDHVLIVGRIVESHMNEKADTERLYALGHEKMGAVRPH